MEINKFATEFNSAEQPVYQYMLQSQEEIGKRHPGAETACSMECSRLGASFLTICSGKSVEAWAIGTSDGLCAQGPRIGHTGVGLGSYCTDSWTRLREERLSSLYISFIVLT